MKRAKGVTRIDGFSSGNGIVKQHGHQSHSFAFNILAAILWARNSLQSLNFQHVIESWPINQSLKEILDPLQQPHSTV